MKRTIDLDQVRVVQADNYKGNSRVYLEILDARVLYSSPGQLKYGNLSYLVNDVNVVDTEALADLFRTRLAQFLAKILLEDEDIARAFSTDTDREIDYTRPRLEEEES